MVDCANHSHAISDVSSVVSDFLQSEAVRHDEHASGIEEFRDDSVAQTGYVLLGDMSNLDEVLDDLLSVIRSPPRAAERKRYVLGDFVGRGVRRRVRRVRARPRQRCLSSLPQGLED